MDDLNHEKALRPDGIKRRFPAQMAEQQILAERRLDAPGIHLTAKQDGRAVFRSCLTREEAEHLAEVIFNMASPPPASSDGDPGGGAAPKPHEETESSAAPADIDLRLLLPSGEAELSITLRPLRAKSKIARVGDVIRIDEGSSAAPWKGSRDE